MMRSVYKERKKCVCNMHWINGVGKYVNACHSREKERKKKIE
jgi:hypothetical protein